MKVLFGFLLLAVLAMDAAAQIKVACLGNSITYGHGLKRPETYPARLDSILGDGWEVQNFGVSGATLLSKGNLPYIRQKAYADGKAFAPDVVIIKLGTNDSKPLNWKFKDEFMADYAAMISELKNLPSHPIIFICLPVPAYGINFQINDTIVNNNVVPLIRKIAKKNKVKLIDLYHPMSNHAAWFPDKIHPTADGAAEIARLVSVDIIKNRKKIEKNKKK